MAKKLKRAFTITELVIVIAVVAILAAVLIPTFANIINKADESADTQVAREMNTALSIGSAEGNPDSMEEVLDILLTEGGFDMAKVNPSSEGYLYAWERESNQILLLNGAGKVIYSNRAYNESSWDLNIPVGNTQTATALNVFSGAANVYVSQDLTFDFDLKNTVSFEVASGKTLTGNVTLGGTNEGEASVRGNIAGTLTVNNANAEVSHYDTVNSVDLLAVKDSSYHEYGTVLGKFSVSQGRVVVENGANVSEISVPAGAQNVKIQSNSAQNVVVTAESAGVTIEEGTGKIFVGGSQADQVVEDNSDVAGVTKKTEVSTADALKSALQGQNDAYVVLASNITITSETGTPFAVNPAGAAKVLDFNGFTITNNSEEYIVDNSSGASLTFTDSAANGGYVSQKRGVKNNGDFVISGGRYTSKSTTGGTLFYNDTGNMVVNDCEVYDIKNFAFVNVSGNTIINGGIVKSISSNEIKSWCYAVRNEGGYMEINGGEVYGIQGCIAIAGGTAVINNVYSETEEGNSRSYYALYIAGEFAENSVVVNGGTFVGGYRQALLCGNSNDGGLGELAQVVINGGTFETKSNNSEAVSADKGEDGYGTGVMIITGGNYSTDPSAYCQVGYESVKEGNYFVVREAA